MSAVAHAYIGNHRPFTLDTEPMVPDWVRNSKPMPGTDAPTACDLAQHDFDSGLRIRIDGDDRLLMRALLTEMAEVDSEAKYLLNKIMGAA